MSIIDFKKDLEEAILYELSTLGITYPNTDLRKFVIHYFNTKQKLIRVQKHSVHKSRELTSKASGTDYEPFIQVIEQKLINGEDINAHLSKQSLNPDFDDKLLSDWTIYHIHLSNTKKDPNQYFYDRAANLLFVFILNNNAYFVDVLPHQENHVFAKKEFLEIIKRNWPHLIKHAQIPVLDVVREFSDEDISKLRKAGINVITKIGGSVYLPPGGGIMTSGDSSQSVIKATNLLKDLDHLENIFKSQQSKIIDAILKKDSNVPTELSFKLKLKNDMFIIKEENSGNEFTLSSNRQLVLI